MTAKRRVAAVTLWSTKTDVLVPDMILSKRFAMVWRALLLRTPRRATFRYVASGPVIYWARAYTFQLFSARGLQSDMLKHRQSHSMGENQVCSVVVTADLIESAVKRRWEDTHSPPPA